MIYIAYFILFFAGIQFIVALSNFMFSQVLRENISKEKPLISVLIPARNEESNIGNLLNDLINQNYENIEIIVFNDESIDNTENIVKDFTKKQNIINLINSNGLLDGWLGKNYACNSLAQIAKGKYFLFLDADVRVGKNLIESALSYIQKYKLSLISIFPKQIMLTTPEKIVVPIMNWILLSLLPLRLVRKSKHSSLAAANGQFMFFDSESYKKFEPHKKFRNSKVEDILISRFLKKNNYKIDCLTGNDDIQCRMYSNYNDAINGFTKNVAEFFGGSIFVGIIFWFISLFGIIFIVLSLPIIFTIIYLSLIIFTNIFISISSKQSIIVNIIFHFLKLFSLGCIIFRKILNAKKNRNQWKGRYIK
ncbi:MAG: glycosyltransferase family 2 protein [Ignavibacteriales bacterium]|nr:glycosyltransferase family 2 protein [Ignavibacteriales bacterium]